MNHLPNFLRAQTPSGLRRLMAINSRRLKGYVKYSVPTYVESEKRWYTWYEVTEEMAQLEETLSGQEQEESR